MSRLWWMFFIELIQNWDTQMDRTKYEFKVCKYIELKIEYDMRLVINNELHIITVRISSRTYVFTWPHSWFSII